MVIHTNHICNPWNYQKGRALPVSFLVFHYVGGTGGAEANARYFQNTTNTKSSAHYFVDHAALGAEIWASVPENDTAWHCGRTDGKYKHPTCRNANSIGIEMCCHKDSSGQWYIDEATMAAAAELGRKIMDQYNIPMENVLRHYDVTGKLCPAPLVDETAWSNFKKRLEVEEEVNQDQFNEMMVMNQVQNREKPVSDWAKPAWEKATAAGIFDGTAPQSPLTREQAAQVLDRLGMLGK